MDYASVPPDIPEITVLLLGDADVGKSLFLSRLTLGMPAPPSSSSTSLASDPPPPYSLPTLHDSSQPFAFDITLYNRPYRLNFYDTASPTSYILLRPHFVILCYSIASRPSLESLSTRWLPVINTHFNHDENLPVMVLGLKRDLRKQWTVGEVEGGAGAQGSVMGDGVGRGEGRKEGKRMGKGESVMPHEGLQAAQRMLCDHYAECSALTGELCRQVLEDVARTCAKTTTEKGAKSQGMDCLVM
ncbi:P-loop containing nucleoside triphosphate hydrolase protein [Plenodomus tracheiphilus IPT5]|uniref:P-loop containing nucleoside triphosphate hydrolase protein n=1 Tax=Plenodomus tracheiphilus IPT5 TaxID=1408161 RepID=A0A6A7B115_9PLEO|nr:P-loop containing nucleoside triphosphate hydrolase protein [Plenodomus tracheiphilus IPT5]